MVKDKFFNFNISLKTVAMILLYTIVGAFLLGASAMGIKSALFSSPVPVERTPRVHVGNSKQALTALELRITQDFEKKEEHARDMDTVKDTLQRVEENIDSTLTRMETQQTSAYQRIGVAHQRIETAQQSLSTAQSDLHATQTELGRRIDRIEDRTP